MGLEEKIKLGETIPVLLEKIEDKMERFWFQLVRLKKLKVGIN